MASSPSPSSNHGRIGQRGRKRDSPVEPRTALAFFFNDSCVADLAVLAVSAARIASHYTAAGDVCRHGELQATPPARDRCCDRTNRTAKTGHTVRAEDRDT